MNVLCAICQDLLVPSSDIFTTPCGHVFHFPCLIQWLEKSHSCPQCRQKVLRDKVIRIFFNFTTTEDIKEDSVTLQQKVDSLSFQVKLKETEYKNCLNENASIKKQFSGLRDEYKKVESDLLGKIAVIRAMKEEASYFQEKYKDYEKLQKEKNKLEKSIKQYENVKALLCKSEQYVDRMLNETTDLHTLAIYASIMKKELNICIAKKKELRESVRQLQQQLQNLKVEKTTCANNYIKQIEELQEALAILQSENDLLHKKIASMTDQTKEPDDTNNEATETSEESTGSRKRGIEFDFDCNVIMPKKRKEEVEFPKPTTSEKHDDSDIVFVSPVPVKKPKENVENSPYLPTKSKSLIPHKDKSTGGNGFSLKPAVSSSKKPGLTFKNSQGQDNAIVFDGFGGHSKLDVFPIPKPSSSPNKLKRSVIGDSSKAKRIKLQKMKILNSKRMDDFVINLT